MSARRKPRPGSAQGGAAPDLGGGPACPPPSAKATQAAASPPFDARPGPAEADNAARGGLSRLGLWWQRVMGAWLAAELLRLARLRRSPLARRFLLGKLCSILAIAGGMIALTPVRGTLESQFRRDLQAEVRLVAAMLAPSPLEHRRASGADTDRASGEDLVGRVSARHLLAQLPLSEGRLAFLYDMHGRWLSDTLDGHAAGPAQDRNPNPTAGAHDLPAHPRPARGASAAQRDAAAAYRPTPAAELLRAQAQDLARAGLDLAEGPGAEPLFGDIHGAEGAAYLALTLPFQGPEGAVGRLVLAASRDAVESLIWAERIRLAQIYLVAMALSLTISARLVWTITAPLSDLSSAIELGGDRHARTMSPERIRIPDLSYRRDEMGRLSEAMRGMVAALYDRIESNEQFAADVAHEIKNPLASLRSAAATLPMARDEAQRGQLLAVINQDVRRLDRLVSDISNASRLDRELVHETEEDFDLVEMLRELCSFLGSQAEEKGIDFILDLPPEPLPLSGLEARLAQVFVNIVSNAISFCQDGDAVRLWARRHDNRVLVVIEDTGPGIPESALTKIFTRFYSERPEGQFGSHSGLGLAISKQIVEAHGGVIWAENIRAADADPGSDPLGARFVVGLPV